jgi:molecular chaperone HtpG
MRRMMQAMGQEVPKTRRVLELNPAHPLLKRLLERLGTERDSEAFAAQAGLLYDLALVAEGSQPRNPQAFTQALASRLAE